MQSFSGTPQALLAEQTRSSDLLSTLPTELQDQIFASLSIPDLLRLHTTSRKLYKHIRGDLDRLGKHIIKHERLRLEAAFLDWDVRMDPQLLAALVHFDKSHDLYSDSKVSPSAAFASSYVRATSTPITKQYAVECAVQALFAIQAEVENGRYLRLSTIQQTSSDRAAAVLLHHVSRQLVTKSEATIFVQRIRAELPFGRALTTVTVRSGDYVLGKRCVACVYRQDRGTDQTCCMHADFVSKLGLRALESVPTLPTNLEYVVRKEVATRIGQSKYLTSKAASNTVLVAAMLGATYVWETTGHW
ncbi:hypothetical protein LTR56_004708 [Elasticomyces elasticus]|nr:hypothetical protein LTR56_004708 [Elasticomyces elasticus]KAK3665563.1 hypothetical protein LTR22_003503 [Elasticomyces elasticus]KAK4930399.1 hypothetical protein LTR49_003140 [Elasticomyces elasticus]KAK5768874.1 hypothetical protein LTS12_000934 [Elasticomyces elasticus]